MRSQTSLLAVEPPFKRSVARIHIGSSIQIAAVVAAGRDPGLPLPPWNPVLKLK